MTTDLTTNHAQMAERLDLQGKRVVDVGCGAGSLVRWMRKQGADAVGVECGEIMMDMARTADPEHVDSYLDGVGQDLPIDDASADVVVFSYSLHHVPHGEMVNALAEAHRVLRPGGTLYVLEPVPAGPGFETVKPIDDETHVRSLAQDALAQAATVGFRKTEEDRYMTAQTYVDLDAWEKVVVGIDPSRAEAMAQHRETVGELFRLHGDKGDTGWTFTQEVHRQIFEKAQ